MRGSFVNLARNGLRKRETKIRRPNERACYTSKIRVTKERRGRLLIELATPSLRPGLAN